MGTGNRGVGDVFDLGVEARQQVCVGIVLGVGQVASEERLRAGAEVDGGGGGSAAGGIEPVEDLNRVLVAVTIGVGRVGVGEREAVAARGRRLLAVEKAVAVGIGQERMGAGVIGIDVRAAIGLDPVEQAVAIGIREVRIAPPLEFLQVGGAVLVGVLGVIIRTDFSRKLLSGREADVQVLVRGSDSNTASIALGRAAMRPGCGARSTSQALPAARASTRRA